MGGNRVVKWRWYYNLFITFTVSGLWHGANWTFVAWGAFHGILLIIENTTNPSYLPIEKKIRAGALRIPYNVFQTLKIFSLACLGWIFFRANNISEAFYIIAHSFNLSGGIDTGFLLSQIPKFAVVAIGIMSFIQFIRLQKGESMRVMIARQPMLLRWSLYVGIILIIAFYGSFHSKTEFIYFQF